MKRSSIFLALAAPAGALALALAMMVQVAGAAHPRPKSATPARMALVPAYAPCAAPNRTHGPPLGFASCHPPAQTSAQATVGTPDAFGGAAKSTSHLRLSYLPCQGGNCFPQFDDMGIEIALNDVRCVPTGARCGTANAPGTADYSGEMRFSFTVRLTDHNNAIAPGGGTDAATVQDFTTGFAWACVPSGSTSIGATCNLNTTLQAQVPGAANGDKRKVWELVAVEIYDGGADGDGDTTADNTLFARPGLFVP
jgi:hypothetical protein